MKHVPGDFPPSAQGDEGCGGSRGFPYRNHQGAGVYWVSGLGFIGFIGFRV